MGQANRLLTKDDFRLDGDLFQLCCILTATKIALRKDEIVRLAMKETKGHLNPEIVKEMVDDRYHIFPQETE